MSEDPVVSKWYNAKFLKSKFSANLNFWMSYSFNMLSVGFWEQFVITLTVINNA